MKKTLLVLTLLLAACSNHKALDLKALQEKNAYGYDISRNKILNNANKPTFAICQATDGADFIVPDFKSKLQQIKKSKTISGAYLVYRGDDNPITQADLYFYSIENLVDLNAIIYVDELALKNSDKNDVKSFQEQLLLTLKRLEWKTGQKPIIYTNLKFANKYLKNANFTSYALWIIESDNKIKAIR